MPQTRRQVAIANEDTGTVAENKTGQRRTRQRAKAKTKTRTVVVEEAEESLDEEVETGKSLKGKTLQAREGSLGFVTSNGFIQATNFIMDIRSQVISEKYSIKG